MISASVAFEVNISFILYSTTVPVLPQQNPQTQSMPQTEVRPKLTFSFKMPVNTPATQTNEKLELEDTTKQVTNPPPNVVTNEPSSSTYDEYDDYDMDEEIEEDVFVFHSTKSSTSSKPVVDTIIPQAEKATHTPQPTEKTSISISVETPALTEVVAVNNIEQRESEVVEVKDEEVKSFKRRMMVDEDNEDDDVVVSRPLKSVRRGRTRALDSDGDDSDDGIVLSKPNIVSQDNELTKTVNTSASVLQEDDDFEAKAFDPTYISAMVTGKELARQFITGTTTPGWIQCDHLNCSKWRKLPLAISETELEGLQMDSWYCYMHPSSRWASCLVPEEAFD